MDSLQKILYHKYGQKNLASFYMARYATEFIDPSQWVNEFITQLTKLEDHPDILKIYKTEKEPEYKVDSINIKNLFKFLNYRPIELEKKFIFLFDAQDLSPLISNKLLKTFEELNPHFCFILLLPNDTSMLPTVESRAIKLRIPQPSHKMHDTNLCNLDKMKTPMELMNALKQGQATLHANNNDEKQFIEHAVMAILRSARPDSESFQTLERLLLTLKNFETSTNFNNSKLARFAPFFP